jgi:endonuclease G
VDAEPASPLRSAGFVLDQSELIDLRAGALAVPPLGAFRTFQVPVGDIEHLAGIDLGPLVPADVLPPAASRAARGEDAWRPLRTPQDVFLG